MAKFIVKFPEGARIVHFGMPKPKRPKPGQIIEVWDDIARLGRHVVDANGNEQTKTNRPHETFADAYRCQPDLYEEITGVPFFWRTGSGPSKPDDKAGFVPDEDRKGPDFALPEIDVVTLKDPLDVEDDDLEWAPGQGPEVSPAEDDGPRLRNLRRSAQTPPQGDEPPATSTEGDPS